MIAIASLLLVVVLFLTAARVATVALIATGMADESARFQARSALMGVGFTTAEAENVVAHPVRRRIVLWLMTFGNAGIITGITSLLLGFIGTEGDQQLRRVGLLVGGLVVVGLLAMSDGLERLMARVTRWALLRWTHLDVRDYHALLRLGHDYSVIELLTRDDDWLVGRPLAELQLTHEGVVVLGVQRRRGGFVGVPTGSTVIEPGDTVLAYGLLEHLTELDDRHQGIEGDLDHEHAVEEFEHLLHEGETES